MIANATGHTFDTDTFENGTIPAIYSDEYYVGIYGLAGDSYLVFATECTACGESVYYYVLLADPDGALSELIAQSRNYIDLQDAIEALVKTVTDETTGVATDVLTWEDIDGTTIIRDMTVTDFSENANRVTATITVDYYWLIDYVTYEIAGVTVYRTANTDTTSNTTTYYYWYYDDEAGEWACETSEYEVYEILYTDDDTGEETLYYVTYDGDTTYTYYDAEGNNAASMGETLKDLIPEPEKGYVFLYLFSTVTEEVALESAGCECDNHDTATGTCDNGCCEYDETDGWDCGYVASVSCECSSFTGVSDCSDTECTWNGTSKTWNCGYNGTTGSCTCADCSGSCSCVHTVTCENLRRRVHVHGRRLGLHLWDLRERGDH